MSDWMTLSECAADPRWKDGAKLDFLEGDSSCEGTNLAVVRNNALYWGEHGMTHVMIRKNVCADRRWRFVSEPPTLLEAAKEFVDKLRCDGDAAMYCVQFESLRNAIAREEAKQ